jgi:Ca2+-binding RTX toxin-like protein
MRTFTAADGLVHVTRLCRVFAVVALVAPALATDALAASVFVDGNTDIYYEAGPGERNDLVIFGESAFIRFTDARAPITAGKRCVSLGPREARCELAGSSNVIVRLHDRSDRVSVASDCQPNCFDNFLFFYDGPGNDRYVGGDEDDAFDATARTNGADVFIGGLGVDNAYYGRRGSRVHISLDGRADDGERGEHDNISRDVEEIEAGLGGVTFIGNGRANWAFSQNLDWSVSDILIGRGGNDRLFGGVGEDVIRGGPGADRLWGLASSDVLIGGRGNDTIGAGSGNDVLRGGLGVDVLHGSRDNDIYYAEDGLRDRLRDNFGFDRAWVDARDFVRGIEDLR